MGGDKAGAVLDGRTLLERAVDLVREAGLQPRVCARASTLLPAVPGLAPDAIWREPLPTTDTDAAHPLAGLALALAQAGEPIVVLPVDLPLLPPDALRALATWPSASSAVLGIEGRPAALVARIEPALSAPLAQAAADHAPALRTLTALGVAVAELADLVAPADVAAALTNVNGPDDLAAVERLLRANG